MSKIKRFFFYGIFVQNGASAHGDVVVLGEHPAVKVVSVNLISSFSRRAIERLKNIPHNFSSVVPGVFKVCSK